MRVFRLLSLRTICCLNTQKFLNSVHGTWFSITIIDQKYDFIKEYFSHKWKENVSWIKPKYSLITFVVNKVVRDSLNPLSRLFLQSYLFRYRLYNAKNIQYTKEHISFDVLRSYSLYHDEMDLNKNYVHFIVLIYTNSNMT